MSKSTYRRAGAADEQVGASGSTLREREAKGEEGSGAIGANCTALSEEAPVATAHNAVVTTFVDTQLRRSTPTLPYRVSGKRNGLQTGGDLRELGEGWEAERGDITTKGCRCGLHHPTTVLSATAEVTGA